VLLGAALLAGTVRVFRRPSGEPAVTATNAVDTRTRIATCANASRAIRKVRVDGNKKTVLAQ
jgi:hypothetical protein